MLSDIRVGHFTSSSIYKLMAKGRGSAPSKVKLTYIEEVGIERRLGRGLNSATSSRPTEWGHALEPRVTEFLDLEYDYVSDQTLVHPTIHDWAGTPDLIGDNVVGDIKCPYTLKSFAQLVDSMTKGQDSLKATHPEYYWQLISNAILTGSDWAELIVYCPYQSELDAIREMVENMDDADDQTTYQWINFNPDEKLPYILEGGYYKNLNRCKFEVLPGEKAALTAAVREAVDLLVDAG